MSRTTAAKVTLAGEDYIILPRTEYDRLTGLARAADLPPLPAADRLGRVPAVDYARASLARKLICLRADAGLTLRELAALAGVRFETICRIEKGRHTPSTATMQKLDRALRRHAAGRKPAHRRRPARKRA